MSGQENNDKPMLSPEDIEKIVGKAVANETSNLKNNFVQELGKVNQTIQDFSKASSKKNVETDDSLDDILAQVHPDDAKKIEAVFEKRMSKFKSEQEAKFNETLTKEKGSIINEVFSKIDQRESEETKRIDLVSSYPDLIDGNSELFKETKRIYDSLSSTMQGTMEGKEFAAIKAAQNLGIQPQKRRPSVVNSRMPVGSGHGGDDDGDGKITMDYIKKVAKANGLDPNSLAASYKAKGLM